MHNRKGRLNFLYSEQIDLSEIDAIRQHSQRQHAYGGDGFCRITEAELGHRGGAGKIGLPRKTDSPIRGKVHSDPGFRTRVFE